jgi:hypothetical protein
MENADSSGGEERMSEEHQAEYAMELKSRAVQRWKA